MTNVRTHVSVFTHYNKAAVKRTEDKRNTENIAGQYIQQTVNSGTKRNLTNIKVI